MGMLIQAKCEKCEYRKLLHIGGGLRDMSSDAALLIMNKEDAELFVKTNAAVKGFGISRVPVRCLSCGNVYAGASVDWNCGDEKKISQNICPECGSSERENIDTEKGCICPDCGGIIKFTEAGFWD